MGKGEWRGRKVNESEDLQLRTTASMFSLAGAVLLRLARGAATAREAVARVARIPVRMLKRRAWGGSEV